MFGLTRRVNDEGKIPSSTYTDSGKAGYLANYRNAWLIYTGISIWCGYCEVRGPALAWNTPQIRCTWLPWTIPVTFLLLFSTKYSRTRVTLNYTPTFQLWFYNSYSDPTDRPGADPLPFCAWENVGELFSYWSWVLVRACEREIKAFCAEVKHFEKAWPLQIKSWQEIIKKNKTKTKSTTIMTCT